MGQAVEMEYADGKLTGGPDETLKTMQTPVELLLGRDGSAKAQWTPGARYEPMGFVGGRLPDRAVRVGETWEDSISIPLGDGSERIMPVKPRLASAGAGGARIEARLDEPIELGSGKGRATLVRSLTFDTKNHRAISGSQEISVEISGPRQRVDVSSWVVTFEAAARE
jgi:hypothetical protein